MSRPTRILAVAVVMCVALLGPAGQAMAQIGDIIEQIPIPTDIPDEIEDPLADIIDQVEDGLSPILEPIGGIPLDNAVRLAGNDGVEAAINLSRATFPDGTSPVALLSRSTLFPDSLSSGGAQGVVQAPLLVTGEEALDERVAAELERLGTSQVIVLGDEAAIAEGVVEELEALDLTVNRVGGPTRIETAWEIAGALMSDAQTAILVRAYPDAGADDAQAYVDTLSVGPWAAELDIPILLTQTEVLTGSLRRYLEASDITNIIIVGGEAAVSPAVEAELVEMGIEGARVAGNNRFGTAVAVAIARGYETVGDVSRLILAEHDGRADVWVPGFAAAANGGLYDGPILLTDGLSVPPETLAYILDGLQDNLVNLGGAPVICTSFVNLLPCELIALLMLGSVAEVEAIIGDLPVISDVLDVIGLGGDDEDPEGDPEDPEGDPEDPEGDPEGEGMFCDPIFGTGLCLDDLLPVT